MLHILIPGIVLYGDRHIKSAARQEQEMVPPFPKHMQWYHVENPGLAGGVLKEKPKAALLVQAISSILILISLLFHRCDKSSAEKAGSTFMLFGALSNLYDRLEHGSVTDMLRFPKAPGRLKSLVFNIADFMLIFGAILTVIGTLFRKK